MVNEIFQNVNWGRVGRLYCKNRLETIGKWKKLLFVEDGLLFVGG